MSSPNESDPSEPITDQERLVEALLPEALGAPGPPDITDRLLERVRQQDLWKFWKSAGMAAAVLLVCGVAAWLAIGLPDGEDNRIAQTAPALPTSRMAATQGIPPGFSTTGGVHVLRPTGRDTTIAWGTEEEPGTLQIEGAVLLQLSRWSTVECERMGNFTRVILHEGSVRCEKQGPGELVVASVHGMARFEQVGVSVSATCFGISGDGAQNPPIAVLFSVAHGGAVLEGHWGSTEIVDDQLFLMEDGAVSVMEGRRRLYPGAARVPKGVVTYEGPMGWGPSGWTIRAANRRAYVVMREPSLTAAAEDSREAPNRFQLGWIYQVTWEDGVMKSAEPIRQPAVKFR